LSQIVKCSGVRTLGPDETGQVLPFQGAAILERENGKEPSCAARRKSRLDIPVDPGIDRTE